jgi:hypothetical protein
MLTVAGGIFLFFAICIGACLGFTAICFIFIAIGGLFNYLFTTKEGFGVFIVGSLFVIFVIENQV